MKITTASLFSLLFCCLTIQAQQTPLFQSIRTTVHTPVQKDSVWEGGTILDEVTFTRFDAKGRIIADNCMKPDGTPVGKMISRYDNQDRICQQIRLTEQNGAESIDHFLYDERNLVVGIVTIGKVGDTLRVNLASYDEKGRFIKLFHNNKKGGYISITEFIYRPDGKIESHSGRTTSGNPRDIQFKKRILPKGDSVIPLRANPTPHTKYLMKWGNEIHDQNRTVITRRDKHGNWTQMLEYNGNAATPSFVIERAISYQNEEHTYTPLLLNGQPKQVKQTVYKPILSGKDQYFRGDKIADVSSFEFDTEGRKVSESLIKEGKIVGKILYTYNNNGEPSIATHQDNQGKVIKMGKYSYSKEGELRRITWYDAQNRATAIDLFRYDVEGNLVHEQGNRADGTKYKEYRYLYNSYGQRVAREVILSPEGEEPVHSCLYSWNLQGRLVSEEYFLLPSTDRHLYTYRYNKSGELIGGSEQKSGEEEVKYTYKFHRDEQKNWRVRIKYVNDTAVTYEERDYIYH
ncbi:MAG: hypothetical protein J6C87_09885 [Bacteroides sp.]|nr:hypothetical protein [Bacteroides sp.]